MLKFLKKKKAQGYSLAELLIVVAIIGVLFVLLVPRIGSLFRMVNEMRSKFALKNIQSKINEYTLDTGKYPDRLDDLVTRPSGHAGKGWRGGYVEKNEEWPPVDVKGNPLIYNAPPIIFKDQFDHYELYSIGEEDFDSTNRDGFIVVGG